MKFHATNQTLTPASAQAERWLAKQSGTVDLSPRTDSQIRSIEQNALYHAWNAEIERAKGHEPGWAHRHNKLYIGLPILARKQPEQIETLRAMVRPLREEQRLEAMDYINCTKLFTVAEMDEFLYNVQLYWAENGTVLE